MERSFASRDKVISQMDTSNVTFIGPKGAGKSTTLVEVYYHAVKVGKSAFFYDLHCMAVEGINPNCDGQGKYFFVDNAQLLRRNSLNSITALIVKGKLCMAFSSNVLESEGMSYQNCPIQCREVIRFIPFTRAEVENFVTLHALQESYKHETSLPLIVNEVLVKKLIYADQVDERLTHILQKVVSRIKEGHVNGTHLLRALYLFLHSNHSSINSRNLMMLQRSGFIFHIDGNYFSVWDRHLLFNCLCKVAISNYDLFPQFDLGGAEELKFYDCCQRGPITIACSERGYNINGTTPLPSNPYEIYCHEFKVQGAIGDKIQFQDNTRTCELIKLGRGHPAIDFIVYECEGSVQSKTLFLIQVSAQKYQQRPSGKKLSAVTSKHPRTCFSDITPFKYYKNMFRLPTNQIYFVYSSPLVSKVSGSEGNFVYFHTLNFSLSPSS